MDLKIRHKGGRLGCISFEATRSDATDTQVSPKILYIFSLSFNGNNLIILQTVKLVRIPVRHGFHSRTATPLANRRFEIRH